jgi:ribosomal protein S18 acetylase RimI-like enzyme
VDAIVALINAAAQADTGMNATNRDEKLNRWGLPQLNMATDTLLLLAPGGEAVAFAELWDAAPHVRHQLWGRVHPQHRDRGLGCYLVEWAESRARQGMHNAPPDARISLHTAAPHTDRRACELFEQHGFAPSRHFLRMLVEMAPDEPPPAPVLPDGVKVRPFVLGEDDRAAHRTLTEAFRDHWGHVQSESFEAWFHWIENDPTFDPSLCFLATVNGAGSEQVVGALMARPEWDGDPTFAWIDDLGVLRPWRRQGIALALLHQVFGELHRRGRYMAGLGVDGESLTGATRLYEKAGMRIFQQIDAYEKILRPGRDLSTRAVDA